MLGASHLARTLMCVIGPERQSVESIRMKKLCKSGESPGQLIESSEATGGRG